MESEAFPKSDKQRHRGDHRELKYLFIGTAGMQFDGIVLMTVNLKSVVEMKMELF